jgi:hypothetical protein
VISLYVLFLCQFVLCMVIIHMQCATVQMSLANRSELFIIFYACRSFTNVSCELWFNLVKNSVSI